MTPWAIPAVVLVVLVVLGALVTSWPLHRKPPRRRRSEPSHVRIVRVPYDQDAGRGAEDSKTAT